MEDLCFEEKNIIFKYNNCEYEINTKITMSILRYYFKNKENNSSKEMVKACIVKNNESISNIIDFLSKGQLLFILNTFISNSEVEYKKIKSYDEFTMFLDYYWGIYCNKLKNSLNGVSLKSKIVSQEFISSMNNINLNMQKSLASYANAMINVNNYFDNFFTSINDMMLQFSENIARAFKNIDIEGIKSSFEGCKFLLIELGYPFINIGIDEMKFIYEHRNDENITEIIDNIIISNYSNEEVDRMLENWKQVNFVSKRINIIEQAVYSYHHEKYAVAIPVFFSQIEGLIAEFFNHRETMSGGQYKKYIERTLSDNPDKIEYINEITRAYFFNNILQKFTHGDDIPKFSRHAILHGGDVNYGTKINNLNIMIMFDTIVECMCSIREK